MAFGNENARNVQKINNRVLCKGIGRKEKSRTILGSLAWVVGLMASLTETRKKEEQSGPVT